MNTIIFQTIRAGVVLGVALFAFASDVFAAPSLTPATAVQITSEGATLVGHVFNPNKNSTVWFEWSTNSSLAAPLTIGMNAVYNEGFFQGYLSNLSSGATYYYRAASMEGGATVYSPIASFTTTVPRSTPAATVSFPAVSVSTDSTTNNTLTSSGNAQTAQTQTVSSVKKSTIATTATKRTTTSTVSSNTVNTNSNTAAVIGAGGGVFPATLTGWIALFILLLLTILIVHMIYEQGEKRKKKLDPHETETGMVKA